MRTWLTDRFSLEVPIIQAPMAGVSTPEMAAAVSAAGGLGSLGVGAATPDVAREMIAQVRKFTDKPLNINVFCHLPAQRNSATERAWLDVLRPEFDKFEATPPAELAEIYQSYLTDDAMHRMLLDVRPDVVSFHFGLPDVAKIRALKHAGIVLLASATSLQEAQACARAGVDAIVAQGIEAGGHRGIFDLDAADQELTTAALVKTLVDHLDLPVIAAGGVMNGQDVAQMLALGAAGCQLGTAFVACDESAADAAYRAALHDPACQPPVLTRVVSGRPARCLANQFVQWGQDQDISSVPAYPVTYDAGKSLNAAAKAQGNTGYGAQWAGTGAMSAKAGPAKEILAALALELAANS